MMLKHKTKEESAEQTKAGLPEDRERAKSADQTESGEEHAEDGNELGSVQIHNHVIATIARLAALKVAGVVELSGNIVDGLAGFIGRKTSDRGIQVDIQDNAVVLDLHVILEYGVRIPQVSWQIQNEVRQAVSQMTGKSVKAVNVIVQTLKFPGETTTAEEGG